MFVLLKITKLRGLSVRMDHMQNRTTFYEAPSATVVKLGTEGLICSSPFMTIFLTDPYAAEVNFGRNSYDSAPSQNWD